MNINDNVKVELTKEGKKILDRDCPTLAQFYHETDNTFKFQLWELMKIYGKYMENGMNQVFVNNTIHVKRKEGNE